MNFLPAFAAWQFALAGLLCAALPLIIHLLNRRRYRVRHWAAMHLLREALQRHRRILHLRDILLLVLRTAAILFFGLALAQPYLSSSDEQLNNGQPIHAVLLIDNSLSMGYQTLAGSLLELSQRRAAGLIEQLPAGSLISLLPIAGSDQNGATQAYDSKPAALEALQRVAVVDRTASISQVLNAARRSAAGPRLAERFFLFSDHQRINWRDLTALNQQPDLPALQLIQVATPDRDNTWVSQVQLQDGVADAETPSTITAIIRHRGQHPRGDLRVALSVNGIEVDSQVIPLTTNDVTREVSFQYTFREFQPESTRPAFVPVEISLSPDRLAEDDRRQILVPVVAVLPVVFVDQFGAELESAAENRLGETRQLRHLLAPAGSRVESRRLIEVRHVRIEQLTRELLADARLTVIAGVTDPSDKVELLRDYVNQGGQLVLAAGADFDPGKWHEAAWRDGDGILPLPLSAEPLGTLPEMATGDLTPFFLSFESLRHHPYFMLAGNSDEDLRDLYVEPFFFKAVAADAGPSVLSQLQQTLAERRADRDATGKSMSSPRAPDGQDHTGWLLWSPPEEEFAASSTATDPESALSDELAIRREMPTVLARFTSDQGPPFLVERSMGRGRVLLATSGLLSSWNTLPKTNAIVIFDRILRSMIQSTLPQREYGNVDQIVVPIPAEYRDARIFLDRPGEQRTTEVLDIAFVRQNQLGVTINHPLDRGIYRLFVPDGGDPATSADPAARPLWQHEVSVNGDPEESQLEPLDRALFEQQVTTDRLQWVGLNESINLAGARIRGQDFWWWLALAVGVLLLGELAVLILTRPRFSGEPRVATRQGEILG